MSVHGRFNDNLRFADDIDLIDQNCNSPQQAINNLLYTKNSETLAFESKKIKKTCRTERWECKNVEEFVYLRILVSWNKPNYCSKKC